MKKLKKIAYWLNTLQNSNSTTRKQDDIKVVINWESIISTINVQQAKWVSREKLE